MVLQRVKEENERIQKQRKLFLQKQKNIKDGLLAPSDEENAEAMKSIFSPMDFVYIGGQTFRKTLLCQKNCQERSTTSWFRL
jgi:hypothetical protein